MAHATAGYSLYHALLAEGFRLPDECADVHMTFPVDGLIQLHYTVNVTGDDLMKVGRALERLGRGETLLVSRSGLGEGK